MKLSREVVARGKNSLSHTEWYDSETGEICDPPTSAEPAAQADSTPPSAGALDAGADEIIDRITDPADAPDGAEPSAEESGDKPARKRKRRTKEAAEDSGVAGVDSDD